MEKFFIVSLFLITFTFSVLAELRGAVDSIPTWVISSWDKSFFSKRNSKTSYLNPKLITGDFNGDGNQDFAFPIENKTTHKKGFTIIHGGKVTIEIFGTGESGKPGPEDFNWASNWFVYPMGHSIGLCNHGNCLSVEDEQGEGGILYFNGNLYEWLLWGV